MERRKLGNTDIEVSVLCLGTMTFGEQNTEAEGHEQLDYALDHEINFIDTAEMYAVPGRAETQGKTEEIIGSWIKKRNKRDDFILATKVTGPSPGITWIDNLGFSKSRILEAIDGSLKRLNTDYVDLYQLHWPERKTNFFGRRGYHRHDAEWEDNFSEVITTLEDLVKDGKIRQFGLSNETPWGVHRFLEIGKEDRLTPVSVQNPYSLINRLYEVGLAEMSIRENMGLLAYSPLGMGLLSGKYNRGEDTSEHRLNKFHQFKRYNSKNSFAATGQYLTIAEDLGISLTQMSLAFVNQQAFVTSNIIGATSMKQLRENISSASITLDKETLKRINKVHEDIPNPAP